jgi:hypothetical protein
MRPRPTGPQRCGASECERAHGAVNRDYDSGVRNSRLTTAVALVACSLGRHALAGEPVRGGLYFEQQVSTSVDQRPAGSLIRARVWWQGRRMRLEQEPVGGHDGAAVLIVRLDQERAFRLEPARRVAREIDLGAERARSQSELGVAGGRLGGHVRVAHLKRTRQIAGYACQGYRLRTDAGLIDVWLGRDVPADMGSFTDFLDWLGAKDALGPLLKPLRQLPGFPLEMRSRFNVSGRLVETRATVTRVRLGDVPESCFEVPPEYGVEPASADEN